MKDDSSLELGTDMYKINEGDTPLIGEIQTPGFFNLTICFDPEEAVNNILAGKKACMRRETKWIDFWMVQSPCHTVQEGCWSRESTG